MKKIFSFLLLTCFCLTWLGGCSEESAKPSEQESSAAQETTPTPEPSTTPAPTLKSVEFSEEKYKGIKFTVPADWEKQDGGTVMNYVTSYDASSLLSVSVTENNEDTDFALEVTSDLYKSAFISGIATVDGYESVSTSDVTVNGHAGFEHVFKAEVISGPTDVVMTVLEIAENKIATFTFGIVSEADEDTKKAFEEDMNAILKSIDTSELSSENIILPDAESSFPTTATEPEETITMGERNALKKAKSYLSLMPFSYGGLISQLEYEGYTTEESTYGANNCGADWNEQAALKAQSYIDMTEFSRQGLIDQLIYEGFTEEQAEYGVNAVGY